MYLEVQPHAQGLVPHAIQKSIVSRCPLQTSTIGGSIVVAARSAKVQHIQDDDEAAKYEQT